MPPNLESPDENDTIGNPNNNVLNTLYACVCACVYEVRIRRFNCIN